MKIFLISIFFSLSVMARDTSIKMNDTDRDRIFSEGVIIGILLSATTFGPNRKGCIKEVKSIHKKYIDRVEAEEFFEYKDWVRHIKTKKK